MFRRLIGLNLIAAMTFALAVPVGAQTTKPAGDTLRVLCFNIRYMNERDGPDRWSARRDVFFDALKAGDADLIGLQEVVHAQAEEIRAAMRDYEFVGVGRDDGKQKGEYSPVLFKRERFEKLDEGHLWLSQTPQVVGSKGWDADLPRLATWVKLTEKKNANRVFLFVNTHFDHRGRTARVEAARLLRRELLSRSPQIPAILAGDFNATEDDAPYAELVNPPGDSAPKLIDAFRAAHPRRSPDEASFGGFKGIRTGSRIDWILHTPNWQTLSAEIDRMNKDGRYPSDHYPIRAELEWVESR